MNTNELQITTRKVSDLIPYARNARTHSDEQVARIAASIKEFGWTNPILVDGENGIIAGHGRLAAARKLGLKEVPTIELSGLSETQKRAYILADNRLALDAGWDEQMLSLELEDLRDLGADLDLMGFSAEELDNLLTTAGDSEESGGGKPYPDAQTGSLQERYLVPPFSILDSRQGYWQERSRWWEQKMGWTGESREGTLYDENTGLVVKGLPSVSIFDPMLAEIICKWFLPADCLCKICDPFAGGTFGYVAGALGHQFTGIELREDQAKLNQERTKDFRVTYICDDGRNIANHIDQASQDLVFSCPPYFNLEKYSDNPNDASNQSWEGFCEILHDGLVGAMSCLKPNRFAVVVMSNVRGKNGFYLDICEEIKKTMRESGANLYNELILVNVVGSSSLKANKLFRNRKVARVHQEVLVFYKGDPKKIQEHFPVIELPDEDEETEDAEA